MTGSTSTDYSLYMENYDYFALFICFVCGMNYLYVVAERIQSL